jgi:DNA polymerase-3 subunit epsilon
MSTSPNQDRSLKDLFWETWLARNVHVLTPHHAIGDYTADFAHLPTKTILEIDRIAQDIVRSQIKRAGWLIVRINEHEIERNVDACVQKITIFLTNKVSQAKPVERGESRIVKPTVPACKQCGREIPPYQQLCYSCQAQERAKQQQRQIIHWAKEMMQRDDWIVFDTETTGVTKSAEVIEIAIVDSRGTPLLDTLVKPRKGIPRDSSEVHGIYPKDVLHAPSFADIWPQISDYVQKYMLLAYNIAFDLRILTQTAQHYSIPFPQDIQSVCLMQKYAAYQRADDNGQSQSPSLKKACEQLGIQPGQHRALADTQAAWEVLKKLSEKE